MVEIVKASEKHTAAAAETATSSAATVTSLVNSDGASVEPVNANQ